MYAWLQSKQIKALHTKNDLFTVYPSNLHTHVPVSLIIGKLISKQFRTIQMINLCLIMYYKLVIVHHHTPVVF